MPREHAHRRLFGSSLRRLAELKHQLLAQRMVLGDSVTVLGGDLVVGRIAVAVHHAATVVVVLELPHLVDERRLAARKLHDRVVVVDVHLEHLAAVGGGHLPAGKMGVLASLRSEVREEDRDGGEEQREQHERCGAVLRSHREERDGGDDNRQDGESDDDQRVRDPEPERVERNEGSQHGQLIPFSRYCN